MVEILKSLHNFISTYLIIQPIAKHHQSKRKHSNLQISWLPPNTHLENQIIL